MRSRARGIYSCKIGSSPYRERARARARAMAYKAGKVDGSRASIEAPSRLHSNGKERDSIDTPPKQTLRTLIVLRPMDRKRIAVALILLSWLIVIPAWGSGQADQDRDEGVVIETRRVCLLTKCKNHLADTEWERECTCLLWDNSDGTLPESPFVRAALAFAETWKMLVISMILIAGFAVFQCACCLCVGRALNPCTGGCCCCCCQLCPCCARNRWSDRPIQTKEQDKAKTQ